MNPSNPKDFSFSETRPFDFKIRSHVFTLLDGFVVLWLIVWTLFLIVKTYGLYIDDAFITYTFAKQIWEGEGWTWQTGERVFGNTTPLYTFICSLLYGLVGPDLLSDASNALSCVALAVQGGLFYLLIRRFSPLPGLVALALFLSTTQTSWYVGMEANVLGLVLLSSVYFWMTGRSGWAGLFLGMGFLLRYDSILLVLVLSAVHLAIWKNFPKRPAVFFSLVGLFMGLLWKRIAPFVLYKNGDLCV